MRGGGYINIGSYIHIAAFGIFFGGSGIVMEDFTTTSSRVCIYSVSDDYSGETMTNPMVSEKYKKLEYGKVTIKKHSIIGTGTTILPGVTLEEGTSIGANSLVLKSTESWGIYAGSPIKKLKDRKKDLLKQEKEFLKNKK